MSKIFFDANILLDILIPNRPNHLKAVKVYDTVCEKYDVLATSENILTTIEYIASKNGTDCEVVWRFFNSLKQNFELYSFSEILDESLEIYHRACKNREKIDFEDLLQLESAIKNSCQVFLTEDKGIGKLKAGIEVLTLRDF
jgi:predicted nucleic acid-binding protein